MERVRLGRAGCLNTPDWTRNDIFDIQRTMSMKILVEKGKTCNHMTKVKRSGNSNELI